jgi:thioredoxin-related protein
MSLYGRVAVSSLVLSALICSCALAEDPAWTNDFTKAKSVAAEKKLPILALFTGSDWCPWCMKLNSEILSTDDFKTYAKDNLVLFIADFPRKSELPKEIKKQNEDLADKYKIPGFPTVVLMDATGKDLGQLGYQEGGGKVFVESVKKLLKKK